MEYQYQRPKSPYSVTGEQPKSPQSIDKNGQHIAHCLFRERGFEPWPKKYLKYTLMEWYIFLNERQCLPGTWDCPLPNCEIRNGTFRDIILHLEDCHHLKDNTRQYKCPGCQTNVDIDGHTCPGCQSMGHGRKTMLKIKSSFESLLGHCSPRVRPSSSGPSPISPFQPNLGPSHEKDQAPPMSYTAIDPNLNTPTPHLSSQRNRNVFIGPINTQCSPPVYEACARKCCMGSTAADTSYGTELCNMFAAQGASSAASSSQLAWSATAELPPSELSCFGDMNVAPWASDTQPPGNSQHFGALPFGSTLSELPGNFFQDMTNIEGMIPPCFPVDSQTTINYGDVEKEFPGDLTSLSQDQWIQQEDLSSFMHELSDNSPQEYDSIMELASNADLVDDLSSQASTDITMVDTPDTVDTPATSVGPSPTTSDSSSLLECQECKWKPDMKVNRPFKKLRLAVEKHVKRNHQSRDYQCPFCDQVIKKRPDNVKQHVVKKHPEKAEELYPKAAAVTQQSGGRHTLGEKARAPALGKPGTRRRASMPLPATQASPTRAKHLRFSRG